MKHWYYIYKTPDGTQFTYTTATSILEADQAFTKETGVNPIKTKGISVQLLCQDCLQQPPACNGTKCPDAFLTA